MAGDLVEETCQTHSTGQKGNSKSHINKYQEYITDVSTFRTVHVSQPYKRTNTTKVVTAHFAYETFRLQFAADRPTSCGNQTISSTRPSC